jgi:hypothetical protein
MLRKMLESEQMEETHLLGTRLYHVYIATGARQRENISFESNTYCVL